MQGNDNKPPKAWWVNWLIIAVTVIVIMVLSWVQITQSPFLVSHGALGRKSIMSKIVSISGHNRVPLSVTTKVLSRAAVCSMTYWMIVFKSSLINELLSSDWASGLSTCRQSRPEDALNVYTVPVVHPSCRQRMIFGMITESCKKLSASLDLPQLGMR